MSLIPIIIRTFASAKKQDIMGIVIGIDVGISTTKIVGIRDGKVISHISIKATDPSTSLYGACGKSL